MGSSTGLRWQKKESKKLEEKSIEIMQSKKQKEQRFKKSEQSFGNLGTSNILTHV